LEIDDDLSDRTDFETASEIDETNSNDMFVQQLSNYQWQFYINDPISDEHQEILKQRLNEYKEYIRNQLDALNLNLSSEKVNDIVETNTVFIYLKSRCPPPDDNDNRRFREDLVMWDHPNLIKKKKEISFDIPYQYLSTEKQLQYLQRERLRLKETLDKLMTLDDTRSAIRYHLGDTGTDMWWGVPFIYRCIFDQDVSYFEAPSPSTIPGCILLNDWTKNYKIGLLIYIMIKHNIVSYVTDFYCPNT